MKNPILLAAALGLTLGLGACSDDDIVKGGSASEGEAVKFTVGTRDSKTYYGTDDNSGDNWQLYWNYGQDTVRVFSQQTTGATRSDCQGTFADYVVNPYNSTDDASTTKGHQGRLSDGGSVTTTSGGTETQEVLKWANGLNEAGLHHFYAAYPGHISHDLTVSKYISYNSGDTNWNTEAAIFKCPFSYDQKVTVKSTANSSGVHEATADTKAQYMFATHDGNRTDTRYMNFVFHPVMTAIDIVVSRSASADDANRPCNVMGVTIKAKIPTQMATDGHFYYRVYSDANWNTSTPYGSGLCNSNGYLYASTTDGMKWSDDEKKTTNEEFTAIVLDENGNAGVDLKKGEKVTLTVFLPPLDYAANDLEFRVHGVNTGNLQAHITEAISAQDAQTKSAMKKKVGVTINESINDNDWISFMDNNVYLQQLSLPGTNESVSYMLADGNASKAQTLSIIEQLNMGIRAFDVHISHDSGTSFYLSAASKALESSNIMENYDANAADHQKKNCGAASLRTLLKYIIKPWLAAHPNEFVLFSVKVEDNDEWADPNDLLGNDTRAFQRALYKYLSDNDSYEDDGGQNIILEWKRNLTLESVRGKLVVMARNEGSRYTYNAMGNRVCQMASSYTGYGTSVSSLNMYAGASSYSNADAERKCKLYYFARNSGSNWTSSSNGRTRLGYITKMLATTKAQSATDAYPWSICYIAGSSAYIANSNGTLSNTGNTADYINNAANQHPLFLNWMNSQTSFGPLGIIFMDWLGTRTMTNQKGTTVTTYGDLLPAAIMMNNYRFQLKRDRTGN